MTFLSENVRTMFRFNIIKMFNFEFLKCLTLYNVVEIIVRFKIKGQKMLHFMNLDRCFSTLRKCLFVDDYKANRKS